MVILGIAESHTCTASLLIDGEIVAAVSEERFSRRKGQEGFPKQAIQYCLSKVPPSRSLDYVVISGNHPPEVYMVSRADTFSIQDYVDAMHKYFKPMFYEGIDLETARKNYYGPLIEKADLKKTNYLWNGFTPSFNYKKDVEDFWKIRIDTIRQSTSIPEDKVRVINHHKCHAAYAYFASPFRRENTLVLTMDGAGDVENCTVSVVRDEKIEEIFRTNNCTLGKHWRYITLLLGMKPEEHEYKVMGLAPYAKEYMVEKVEAIFSDHLTVDGLDFKYNKKPTDLYFYYRELLEGYRFDAISGGLQSFSEKLMKTWVGNCIAKTGIHKVVFSGGVAMNIKVNKVIAEMPEVHDFFVAPSGGDESLPLGACYYQNSDQGNKNLPIKDAYLGPSFDNDAIEEAIKGHDFKVVRRVTNKEIAKHLVEGNIIGRCVDRMEFGARALGNRSIIADPSRWDTLQKINTKIKFRDFWMPFTPSLLSRRAKDYFHNPKNLRAPFMTLAFDSTDLGKEHFRAAIHPEDKTLRAQVLEKETNPQYYDLIEEFEKITGIGGLLNTSLNLHGEPVVCDPKDAVHTFINSGLDMMVINDYLLCRSQP